MKELFEKRNKIVAEQRQLNDKAAAEGRDFTAEEQVSWDVMESDFAKIDAQINEERSKAEKAEQRAKAVEKNAKRANESYFKPMLVDPENVAVKEEVRNDQTEMFRRYLLHGRNGFGLEEQRALQADKDTAGGFLVAPEQFTNQLIQKLDNMVFVRQYATKIMVERAASLGAAALDNDPGDPTWTSELGTGALDSTMDFDKRSLTPHPLARRIKVSNRLLRVATMDVEALVRDRLAYKFGVVEENAFLNGTGTNQPLGVFTASAQGINTDRDVSDGNTITAIKADNLINVKYALKAQYRKGCRWIFHRDALKMIRKLKDGEGNYLWRPGISSGAPDTILDLPYDESEYCPSTFTTGLYVGALCDWTYYWVVDSMDFSIQVVSELYSETNQTGYIGRKETDGMPTVSEAFVRVKLA
jgi:HK97 family phage major capsid protein